MQKEAGIRPHLLRITHYVPQAQMVQECVQKSIDTIVSLLPNLDCTYSIAAPLPWSQCLDQSSPEVLVE